MSREIAMLLILAFSTTMTEGNHCQKHRACQWDQFKKGFDWNYLDINTGDCEKCRTKCADVQGCTAYECGEDYCASWLNGACARTRVDTNDGITTCSMFGNMTSEPSRPRASCNNRCGVEAHNSPTRSFNLCSCDDGCAIRTDCCRDYYHFCGDDSNYFTHGDPPQGLPTAPEYSTGTDDGFHSWYYIAPAIMGASITSFCILFVWFRYQRRRRAAAAAQAQRQFQRLEEFSDYDPVIAITPRENDNDGTYAVPVAVDREADDDDVSSLKSAMVYPVAAPVEVTVVPPGSIFPDDVMATVTTADAAPDNATAVTATADTTANENSSENSPENSSPSNEPPSETP